MQNIERQLLAINKRLDTLFVQVQDLAKDVAWPTDDDEDFEEDEESGSDTEPMEEDVDLLAALPIAKRPCPF